VFQLYEAFEQKTWPATARWPAGVRRVRLVGADLLEGIALVDLDATPARAPFVVDYELWANLESSRTRIPDPYQDIPWDTRGLRKASRRRLKLAEAAANSVIDDPSALFRPNHLSSLISSSAEKLRRDRATVRRWIYQWLQAGGEIRSVVRAFATPKKPRPQTSLGKRGPHPKFPENYSGVGLPILRSRLLEGAKLHYIKRGLGIRAAYRETLLDQFHVPEKYVRRENKKKLFLSPELLRKFEIPSDGQFRAICRQLDAEADAADAPKAPPRGKRGRASHDAPGPGFFEIDATIFQVTLVASTYRVALVGQPVVYLIVDVFSEAIVGYAISLENPSWSVAALALANCFSDKASTFLRLGLPYTSRDWSCHELPLRLTADRAELVSNQGQTFPRSGIRVAITPPMTPIAKGTIEGKNSQLKHWARRVRLDLPGRFDKFRKRRGRDGKRDAAMDLHLFEQILVEAILDLNLDPVSTWRIPNDALEDGMKAATRIGLYEWGLKHRAGFTRSAPPNFVYEHLMRPGTAQMTGAGLAFKGELFRCDALTRLGWEGAAGRSGSFEVQIAHHDLVGSEVFFRDPKSNTWHCAKNVNPDIEALGISFFELDQHRARKDQIHSQAEMENHVRRKPVVKRARAAIGGAARETREVVALAGRGARRKTGVLESRAREREARRGEDMAILKGVAAIPSPVAKRQVRSRASVQPKPELDVRELWDEAEAP